MLIKSISFPTPLEDIIDIEEDNIDVFVELEDGYTHTVVVSTPKNLLSLMNKEKSDFAEPDPVIIVRKLTKEIIAKALEAYAKDDAYWLKLYQFSSDIDMATFDKLQAEHIKYLEKLKKLDNS